MLIDAEKTKFIIESHDTIEEAWSKIEENRHRSVIVMEDDVVVGALSDGDLRKAMLSKRLMTTMVREVMNPNFTFLLEKNRDSAPRIAVEKDIFIIPIVDDNFKLIDLFIK